MSDDLVEMARLAQHDERMSTGALYGDLADRIEELEAKLAQQGDLVQAAVAAERERCARVVERMAPYTPDQIARMSDIDRFAEQRKINLSRAYHSIAAATRKGRE